MSPNKLDYPYPQSFHFYTLRSTITCPLSIILLAFLLESQFNRHIPTCRFDRLVQGGLIMLGALVAVLRFLLSRKRGGDQYTT